MRKLIIFIFLMLFITQASAYIMDIPPKPEGCDDCIIPLKVENMQIQEQFQITVILSMIFVNALKTIGMYYMARRKDPQLKFDPSYAVSALLGIFMGYMAFLPSMTYEGTYLNIFMISGYYALGANLMFDFVGKVKEKNAE